MGWSRSKKRKRIMIIVDNVALCLAYIVMLTVRFHWHFKKPWMIPLYTMVFVTEILLFTLIDVYRDRSVKYKALEDCDPLDVLTEVIKNLVVMFLCLLIVLMLSQNTYYASRLAMGILGVLDFLFLFAFRLGYRAVLIKGGNPDIHRRKLATFVYAEDVNVTRAHLEKNLGLEFELDGIYSLDDIYSDDGEANVSKRDELVKKVKTEGCSDVFVCIPDEACGVERIRKDIISHLGKEGINTYYGISVDGLWTTGHLVRNMGYYQAVYYSAMVKRCKVLGVNFAVSNVDSAVTYVRTHLKEFAGKYICFCNVHTTVEASEDPDYMKIQNASALTFPDGQPIVNRIQQAGYVKAERIAGPDFMDAMFSSTMDGRLSHFFYGSTEETIALLKEKLPELFPGMDIRGYYSPPFRELTKEEDDAVVEMLNSSGADLIWIGLGAPKQEKWMAAHEGRVNGVMLGVGAGFNFFAGNIKRAPVWIRKIGMEWLYRLFQDPKRLFKRYFESNLKFIWKAIILRK